MTSRVVTRGPLFDGRALAQVQPMTNEIIDRVSQEAFHEALAAMDAFFKNPTGYYESQVTIDRTRDTAVVHDRGVVYGPWLAGVSSRNERSRFKGYPHWIRAKQRTQGKVARLADPVVKRRVRRMN